MCLVLIETCKSCNIYYPANTKPSNNITNSNTTKILASSSIYSISSPQIGLPPALHPPTHKYIFIHTYTNNVISTPLISCWR